MSKGIKGVWGSLFSPLKKSKEPEKIIKFDDMNIMQLLEYSAQKKSNFTANTGIEMTKRLFEIAYFDYDVSDKERQMAGKLLGALIQDLENGLSSNPEALQAYRAANKYNIDRIELHGIGSLAWKIRAPGISGEDVIRMVIDSSSGPLIPNFLKAMPEETWGQIKGDVIKALRREGRRREEEGKEGDVGSKAF